MRWSESGFLPSSAATSCLISARIAVAEQAPPVSVETWLPKKYFSSKMPRGVSMYFCVVTREMVDSCRPTRLGDLAQHQRAHGDLAVLEEVLLPVDDRLRDAQDGVEALLHVLDQPARLLQLPGEVLAAVLARGLQDVGVHLVDAQPRHRVAVERRGPAPAGLAHDHVGDHVAHVARAERAPGLGIEREHERADVAQLVLVDAEQALQLVEVARREHVEVRA